MSKRKFRTDDGETFEVVDDPHKPKGKPRSRSTRRRYLIGALIAALVILAGLAALLLIPTRTEQKIEATAIIASTTETSMALPTSIVSVPTGTPDPCAAIMNAGTARIALTAQLRGSEDTGLFLMDTAGRALCSLDASAGAQPRWAHDGERLLYGLQVGDQGMSPHWEIVTLDVRSSELTRITDEGTGLHTEPFWSPDDSQIVFRGNNDLYVIDEDSSNLHRLTSDTGRNEEPAWSPDSRWIAFASTRDQAEGQRERDSFEIYVMAADGNSVHRLTDNAVYDYMPAWSPDSRQIAYISNVDPDSDAHTDLFVMDANCDALPGGCKTNRRSLTNTGYNIQCPQWLPDGQHIAYTASEREGDVGLYVLDINSGETRRITRSPIQISTFDWWGN